MVLNTPLSHKLSICCYNADDNRDPSNKYHMNSVMSNLLDFSITLVQD